MGSGKAGDGGCTVTQWMVRYIDEGLLSREYWFVR